MVASKITPSERLLRKRANARLRQQRCRARKKSKMEKESSIPTIAREKMENPASAKQSRIVFPFERDFAKQYYRTMYTHSHGPHTPMEVPSTAAPVTGPPQSHIRARDNITSSDSKSQSNSSNSNFPQDKMGENDLQKVAIEAMLSLRSKSEDSNDSTQPRQMSSSAGAPATHKHINVNHSINPNTNWHVPKSKYYAYHPRQEKFYAPYKDLNSRYNYIAAESRPDYLYMQPGPKNSHRYHPSEFYNRNQHNYVQVSYH